MNSAQTGVAGAHTPLLCLHSSLSSGRQWQALLHDLNLPALAPDLLGYGRSVLPPSHDNFSFRDEAKALLAQLPAEYLQYPVDLVGHSYGGAFAMHLVRTGLLKVRRLVLFEPVAFHLLPQLSDAGLLWQEVSALAAAMPELSPLAAAERFIDYWQQPGYFAALPARMQQQFSSQVGKVTLDFQALSEEPATLAQYAQALQCPVLLLCGLDSRASARRISQALASTLPAVQLTELACGHMGPVTHPELVNPVIQQFLQQA